MKDLFAMKDSLAPPRPPAVVMIGPFPPPVHGMAVINAAMRDRLLGAGVQTVVIDTAAAGLARTKLARLQRGPRVVGALLRLLTMPVQNRAALYMSVSGGWGQLYEVSIAALARLKNLRIFLHHHNYSYIDKPTALARLLFRVAGQNATHIALSVGMVRRLQDEYESVRTIASVSNAVFLCDDSSYQMYLRDGVKTLGFLSNVSKEKGVFEFLDLCAALEKRGLDLRAIIAGPFQDGDTQAAVQSRIKAMPFVSYVGPRYGADKDAFFSEIDVLIFPTQYVNEAEPVTVHEAMRSGVPVIAYGRGAIREMLPDCAGLVVDTGDSLVHRAVDQLLEWHDNSSAYQSACRKSRKAYEAMRSRAAACLEDVLVSLTT